MDKIPNDKKKFDDAFNVIKGQAAKIFGSLFIVILFGVFRLVWIDKKGRYGLLEYCMKKMDVVPNDYKLLVVASIICMIFIMGVTMTIMVDKEHVNPILLGALGIFPVLGNLLTMSFFFYLILYRGLWSLGNLKNGFDIVLIIGTIFFVWIGVTGYKAFSHFYQLRRFMNEDKIDDLIDYASKYKLV